MNNRDNIVIGIDGGGSYTRVTVADFTGQILAQVRKGGTNRLHNIQAEEHLRTGILDALSAAGRQLEHVTSITAALAGIDQPGDEKWAMEVLHELGISTHGQVVNDTLAAHRSIFLGRPGIVAIGGTGSLIFGINEEGRMVRNDDFAHYARVAARFITYETVYAIISGYDEEADLPLVGLMLQHLGCSSTQELAELALRGYGVDKRSQNRMLGDMAHLITEAADTGIPLAVNICNEAARQTAVGIRLIGATFRASEILVSFSGSCITSPYLKKAVLAQLKNGSGIKNETDPKFVYVEQRLPSDIGAVMMAYEAVGRRTTESMMNRLGQPYNINKLEI
ncbi:hypothetical protein BK126_03295 [Paenibacillus sp. FSL H7-0326]|uniref:BadF/BadG/BcrA/BcrD ATPase family protein n=1 Tax=Paenibacillus sp. FSL H7-0326 TaxID=1921144 RepID=UPI00096E144A|nr:BadF/BadG/BcrA/BcrD ATPase family protein [Paenibacillus sp. FSL H7-0326]OMC71151.1 hypothetical protein BK126_03295 [Paenibacillus sp. FSL H7-0326]